MTSHEIPFDFGLRQPVTTRRRIAQQWQEKERLVLVSLALGLLCLAPDLVAAVLARSIMLLSDSLKSASETLAVLFSWLALRQMRRARANEYNYGQGKLENIAGVVVGGALLLSWATVIYSAIQHLRHPAALENIGLAVVINGLEALADLWLWRRNYRLSQTDPSPLLEAQWRLSRALTISDAFVVGALLLSSLCQPFAWATYIDPAGALILSVFLLIAAYRVLTDAMKGLLDRTLEESLQLVILAELATAYDDFIALHGIRSRRSGSQAYIEIFVEFDGTSPMAEVQQQINQMKARLEARIHNSHVMIVPATAPI
ncbi:MAG: cation diffusion facilitator family transporter [Blastocatellia bacterium]